MAEITFDEATKKPTPPQPTQLAVKPDSTLAAPSSYTDAGGFDGEFTREDRQTPRLQIVAKTGALSNDFNPGSFLLNKQADLGKNPLGVVALRVKKLYQEVTSIEEGVMGRTFATAEEVRAAGLRVGLATSKVAGEEAAPIMQILFFIELPDGLKPEVADHFSCVLPSGKQGALALYTAARTNYRTVAQPLVTARDMNKQVRENGVWSQRWQLSAKLEKYESFSWWQGHLTPSGKLDQADADYLKDFAA